MKLYFTMEEMKRQEIETDHVCELWETAHRNDGMAARQRRGLSGYKETANRPSLQIGDKNKNQNDKTVCVYRWRYGGNGNAGL